MGPSLDAGELGGRRGDDGTTETTKVGDGPTHDLPDHPGRTAYQIAPASRSAFTSVSVIPHSSSSAPSPGWWAGPGGPAGVRLNRGAGAG